MARIDCRHFSGYKPCSRNANCDETCGSYDKPRTRILLVHLEALGAVLRTTSILPAIKRKYPASHITWVTRAPAASLLKNNPYVDRVLSTGAEDLAAIRFLEFDIGFCVDKSLHASAIMASATVDQVYGFIADPYTGAILPGTGAARELWELGLDDHKKFFVNQKPETQLLAEALELAYRRDPYVLVLSEDERAAARSLRSAWGSGPVIGLNTGCSPTITAKKLTVEAHRELIRRLRALVPNASLVLLGGGAEDAARNAAIADGLGAIQTPCEDGLRAGMAAVAACDIVVTGDSLGMHLAIALNKWTVAWFGPTCAHEIDLYDRGVKVLAKAPCAPCWKRSCSKSVMCYDLVSLDEVVSGVTKGLDWLASSSKPHSSEIYSSQSP
ncbi:MAG TPA: glycosyltransferase family 9 protein [Bdellovibrionales bacterium]|nr:glycosyltransferase family 9 protein [Bdellovibrionales bacterium]